MQQNWKDFIRFLKKNDLYTQYVYNVKYLNGESKLAYLIKGIYHPIKWINSAFSWSKTKEGYSFWKNWDIKWQHYCCNIHLVY